MGRVKLSHFIIPSYKVPHCLFRKTTEMGWSKVSRTILCCLCLGALLTSVSSADFGDLFQPYWAADHMVAMDGEPLKLTLDNTSG